MCVAGGRVSAASGTTLIRGRNSIGCGESGSWACDIQSLRRPAAPCSARTRSVLESGLREQDVAVFPAGQGPPGGNPFARREFAGPDLRLLRLRRRPFHEEEGGVEPQLGEGRSNPSSGEGESRSVECQPAPVQPGREVEILRQQPRPGPVQVRIIRQRPGDGEDSGLLEQFPQRAGGVRGSRAGRRIGGLPVHRAPHADGRVLLRQATARERVPAAHEAQRLGPPDPEHLAFPFGGGPVQDDARRYRRCRGPCGGRRVALALRGPVSARRQDSTYHAARGGQDQARASSISFPPLMVARSERPLWR